MLCKSLIKSLSYSLHRVVRWWGSGIRQVQILLTSYVICIICALISDSEHQKSDKCLQAHSPMPGTAGCQVTFAFTSTNPTACCFVPGSDSARPRDAHGGKTGNPPSGSSQSSERRKIPLQYVVQPQFQKCPQDTEVRQGGHVDSEGGCISSRASRSR